MKMIGFILITFVGFGAGRLMSQRLAKRVRLLMKLKLLIGSVGMQIQFMSAEIYDILHEMSARSEFARLTFLENCIDYIEGGVDFPTAWENGIEEDENILLLEGEEVELLRSFGTALGTTDTGGQVRICKMYEELMGSGLSAALQKKQQCSRLYTGLGTLIGVGVAVLTL